MRATQAAAQLGVLKFFPTDPQAVLRIARMIEEVLTDGHQVDELVRRMTTSGQYNEWPGPATLLAEAWDIRGDKPGSPEEYVLDKNVGELCKQCDSWGHVLNNGVYERCYCANGIALEQKLLDSLNKRSIKTRGSGDLTPFSQQDFDTTVLQAIQSRLPLLSKGKA